MKFLGVEPQNTEMRKLGKFNKDRTKPHTLLVTLSNEYDRKLVFAKNREKRSELSDKNVFLMPALTADESGKENLCLKKRRELLDEGVEKFLLRIRNFKLFKGNQEIPFEEKNGRRN